MGKSQNGKIITNTYNKLAGAHTVLQPGDLLYIFGNSMQFQRFVETYDLKAMDRDSQQLGEQNHLIHLVNRQFGIAEVILLPSSTFIHHTLKESRFRERYQLNVLAINRRGEYLTHKVGEEPLRFGDTLLVQGSWESLETLQVDLHQFKWESLLIIRLIGGKHGFFYSCGFATQCHGDDRWGVSFY